MPEEFPPTILNFIGHSTLAIEMDGARLLTDPVLRDRVVHLRRHGPPPDPALWSRPDAVLISHLHLDHCDIPSLRVVGSDTRLIVPRGAGAYVTRRGFSQVEELGPGEVTTVGRVQVRGTEANHSGFRPPLGPMAVAMGYLISGSRHIYFAGDTDIFPAMAELGGQLDTALLPIWGWSRSLGQGHLNPATAAEALRLLRPQLAIPIHWGTFRSITIPSTDTAFLTEPPHDFARHAGTLAPEVEVRIVSPGASVVLPPAA